ncbi:hypothetical protein [Streptomyces sp. NPDC018000]|uniref:hypothetical protein n=1 Tax=Streptomyces sp. NPDC018000 TaxID=3365028 RepID=UPI0037AD9A07
MTALFALAAGLLLGPADFGGWLLTRHTPALTVAGARSDGVGVAVVGIASG